jgi:IS30 family transposase
MPDEIRRLKQLAKDDISAAAIAKKLKRSLNSTKKKASQLGLSLGVTQRWTPEDVRRLRSLAKKKVPSTEIARKLGRTRKTIWQRASKLGISLHRVTN